MNNNSIDNNDNYFLSPIPNNPYEVEEEKKKGYLFALLMAFIGALPGILLWILMCYLDFGPSIMGFIIIGGSLILMNKTRCHINLISAGISLLVSLLLITLTACSVEAYLIRKDYNSTVNKEFVNEVKEVFIESMKSSGLTEEEINENLKSKYNIESLNDEEGITKLAKKMHNEAYINDHNLSVVPDSFINSYKCLKDYFNGKSAYSKNFISNIVIGYGFTLLGFFTVYNSTFMLPSQSFPEKKKK